MSGMNPEERAIWETVMEDYYVACLIETLTGYGTKGVSRPALTMQHITPGPGLSFLTHRKMVTQGLENLILNGKVQRTGLISGNYYALVQVDDDSAHEPMLIEAAELEADGEGRTITEQPQQEEVAV